MRNSPPVIHPLPCFKRCSSDQTEADWALSSAAAPVGDFAGGAYEADELDFEMSAYGIDTSADATENPEQSTISLADLYGSDSELPEYQSSSQIEFEPYSADKAQEIEEEPSSKKELNLPEDTKPPRVDLKASGSRQTDFNTRFQAIMEVTDSERKFERMSELANDFAFVAECYGKIIIAEKSLPVELKTIKPISVGGVAGGDKYIVSGILFKFASGETSIEIYGNEENAQKIASHELRGLNEFFLTGVPGLSFPLMALVNYLGFCLIAISVIPVDKNTIQYGSCDAGQTMHFDNMDLYSKIKEGCQKLHLKPHKSGLNPSPADLDQYGPGDIEGHLGIDGRLYMLDFARLMPPECPLPNQIIEKGSLFFKLLRPELVRSNPVPLSSDALTRWGMGDLNKTIHNREVLDATLRLRNEIIPKFAAALSSEIEGNVDSTSDKFLYALADSICHRLHVAGISLRYLGLVRRYTTQEPARSVILSEMICRVLKCKLNEKLRRAVTADVGVAFEKCRAIGADVLGLSIHTGADQEKVNRFWKGKLKNILEIKFPGGLTEQELEDDFDLWTFVTDRTAARTAHITRFLTLTGIQLSSYVQSSIFGEHQQTILPSDVATLAVRTKNMVIGDLSFAFSKYMQAFRLMAMTPPNFEVASRLLELVVSSLKRAPRFTSLFHEKMLISSSKGIQTDSRIDMPNSCVEQISDIVQTTLGSLSQRAGLSADEVARELTKEYVRASRMLRRMGAGTTALAIMYRATFLDCEAKLELFKCLIGENFSNGRDHISLVDEVLAEEPENVRANWYKLRSSFEDRSIRRKAEDFDFEMLVTPAAVKAAAVLVARAPHVFKRRSFRRDLDGYSSTSCLVQASNPSLWQSIENGKDLRQQWSRICGQILSTLSIVRLKHLTLEEPVFSRLLVESAPDVLPATTTFLLERAVFNPPDDLIALQSLLASSKLTTLSLSFMQHIPSVQFLKNLPQLRRLHLTRSCLSPDLIHSLPSVCSNTLCGLHLDGVELDTTDSVVSCLTTMTNLTSFGLPRFSEASPTQTLLQFWQPLLPHIDHLEEISVRSTELDPSFGAAAKDICQSASRLKVLDTFMCSGKSSAPLHEYAMISHESLRLLVLPSAECFVYSGARSVQMTLRRQGLGNSVIGASMDQEDSLEIIKYAADHPELGYGVPQISRADQMRICQGTIPQLAKHGNISFNILALVPDNPTAILYKPVGQLFSNFYNQPFCSISPTTSNTTIAIGSKKYIFAKALVDCMTLAFKDADREVAFLRSVATYGAGITVAPRVCITPYVLALTLLTFISK